MIKELLEGKPFGHPLHPLLVHLPIGLFYSSLLLDLGNLLFDGGNALVRGAFYTMAFGTVMALVAAIPGLMDRADIRRDHPAARLATTHMLLNVTAVGIYLVNLALRYGRLDEPATSGLTLLLSLAAVGIISYSGYLGGTMVYNDGIAVGRHRRHTDTPEATLHVVPVPEDDIFVPVVPAEQVAPGETVRAEVEGFVMTIANVEGDYYAFQEFCSHRFGPLSEGHFHGYEVMCPWHRSCFDVRTGKVTQGPAKVDLKTFDLTVRDGQIHVRLPDRGKNRPNVSRAVLPKDKK